MTDDRPIRVAMCAGSACRKRPEYAELRRDLSSEVELVRFGCVGICTGPVVVVAPDGARPLVVARVRSAKARRDLLRLVRGRAVSDRLRRRLVVGSKSSKAVRRARRAT